MNRRDFVDLTTRAAAMAAVVNNTLPSASAVPSEAATDENFWSSIRNEFTTDRTVINLNNGHVSPAPRTVQDAMKRSLDHQNMGPYHTMIREQEGKVETARRMLAEAAGCDPEEMAITRNASESLEIAQLGVNLRAGDEVLTTNQDYGRMLTTFNQRARREGIKIKTISFPVPVVSMDDLYKRFEEAVTAATKVILVSHITNRTGQIFPVRRICDMAHARGIKVIVDGAHAFNHFPFKISDLDCDYYGVSLHKWTFAPIGTGFLYVRKSLIKDTWPLMAAGERSDSDIRKFEEIGTHPAANHNAICEALTFNQGIGIERKAARLRYLKDRWATRLAKNPKVRILHNPDPEMSCGIGMFGLEGANPRTLSTALQTKYNIYLAVSPHAEYTGIRVTPSVYTTVQEVDFFSSMVEKELG
jgi:selenocysteine lyase/cysteine desulfurase